MTEDRMKKGLFLVAILLCICLICLGGIEKPIPKDYEMIDKITVRFMPSPPRTYVFEEKKDIAKIMKKLSSFLKNEKILVDDGGNGWEISIQLEGEENQAYLIQGNYLIQDEVYYLLTEEDKEEFRELLLHLQ